MVDLKTTATQTGEQIQTDAKAAIENAKAGAIAGVESIRDKFMGMKSKVVSVSNVLKKGASLKEINKLKDTKTGDLTTASIAALALEVTQQAQIKVSLAAGKEYGKLLLKTQMPSKFSKTRLSGVLGISPDQFDKDGNLIGELVPDQDLIDAVETEFRDEYDKYDYGDGVIQ
jgi:hypothetical protein